MVGGICHRALVEEEEDDRQQASPVCICISTIFIFFASRSVGGACHRNLILVNQLLISPGLKQVLLLYFMIKVAK